MYAIFYSFFPTGVIIQDLISLLTSRTDIIVRYFKYLIHSGYRTKGIYFEGGKDRI